MPTVTVEFALAYDPADPYADVSLWDQPWTALRRASENFDTRTTLAKAGMRGGELLVPAPLQTASLDMGGYEVGFLVDENRPPAFVAELDIVDRSGRVYWGQSDWRAITYEQLLRSLDAGTLPGDPRGLCLMRPGRGAGGVVPDWNSFLVVWEVVEGLATGHWLYERAKDIGSRVRRGRKAVENHLPEWQLRGAMTHSFMRLLKQRPWHPDPLAELLDCEPDEAAAVLELYGFSAAEDGLYYPGKDGAAGFLWVLHQRVRESYADSSPALDPLERMLLAQTKNFLEAENQQAELARQRQEPLPSDYPEY